MEPFLSIIFSLIVLLFSVVIHEISHGFVALYLGDPTAKLAGRLTLNPLRHLDPFGSIILPLLLFLFTAGNGPIFGWAKPVPVNPYNFRNQRWGDFLVSIAGPASNFALALFFGLALRFLPLSDQLAQLFSVIVFLNLGLMVFNLIPLPPLDGSHILFALLSSKYYYLKEMLTEYGFLLLLILVFFGVRIVFLGVLFLYKLIVGNLPLIF